MEIVVSSDSIVWHVTEEESRVYGGCAARATLFTKKHMARNLCSSQFKCRNLGFYCTKKEHELFFVSEWTEKRWIFMLYRSLMWAYQFGWWVARYVYDGVYFPDQLYITYRYLTPWTHAIATLYFTVAFILSLIGFISPEKNNGAIKVLRSTTWLLHSVGQSSAIIISIVFWAALKSTVSVEYLTNPLNIHGHAVIALLFIVEIFVVGFPMRLFHAIYVILFALAYVIATLIYHATGITSEVYPILDWENDPGLAASVSVALCLFASAIVHSIMFGVYCLRATLSQRNHESAISTIRIERTKDNPVFEDDNQQ